MMCVCGKEYEGNFCPHCGRKKEKKTLCEFGKEYEGNFCPYCGRPSEPSSAGRSTSHSSHATAGGSVTLLQKIADAPMRKWIIGAIGAIAVGFALLCVIAFLLSNAADRDYIEKAQNAAYHGVTYKALFDNLSGETDWECTDTGEFEKYGFRFNAIVNMSATCNFAGKDTPYTVTFYVADEENSNYVADEGKNVILAYFVIDAPETDFDDSKETLMERVFEIYREDHS